MSDTTPTTIIGLCGPAGSGTKTDLYLSGPMTGLPGFNDQAFNDAAQTLRSFGYTVFNPVDNGVPPDAAWAEHMRADIAALMQCAHLVALPGHENSRGARLEIHIAKALGMSVYPLQPLLEISRAYGHPYTTPTTATT